MPREQAFKTTPPDPPSAHLESLLVQAGATQPQPGNPHPQTARQPPGATEPDIQLAAFGLQACLQTAPENSAGNAGTGAPVAPDNAADTVVHGTQLVIRVEDDGPGLPATQRESIFERGVRLDERTPGSGLGLAIVRDLAQAYGGSVRAFASEKGGLGVELNLPGLESVNKARP